MLKWQSIWALNMEYLLLNKVLLPPSIVLYTFYQRSYCTRSYYPQEANTTSYNYSLIVRYTIHKVIAGLILNWPHMANRFELEWRVIGDGNFDQCTVLYIHVLACSENRNHSRCPQRKIFKRGGSSYRDKQANCDTRWHYANI